MATWSSFAGKCVAGSLQSGSGFRFDLVNGEISGAMRSDGSTQHRDILVQLVSSCPYEAGYAYHIHEMLLAVPFIVPGIVGRTGGIGKNDQDRFWHHKPPGYHATLIACV